MKRYNILPKMVGDQESLDIIWEESGNPDLVICYGLDCYESGEIKGLVVGALAGAAACLAAVFIVRHVKRRNGHGTQNR